jgi:hypothetical protein
MVGIEDTSTAGSRCRVSRSGLTPWPSQPCSTVSRGFPSLQPNLHLRPGLSMILPVPHRHSILHKPAFRTGTQSQTSADVSCLPRRKAGLRVRYGCSTSRCRKRRCQDGEVGVEDFSSVDCTRGQRTGSEEVTTCSSVTPHEMYLFDKHITREHPVGPNVIATSGILERKALCISLADHNDGMVLHLSFFTATTVQLLCPSLLPLQIHPLQLRN